jgi:hypothetical protein
MAKLIRPYDNYFAQKVEVKSFRAIKALFMDQFVDFTKSIHRGKIENIAMQYQDAISR